MNLTIYSTKQTIKETNHKSIYLVYNEIDHLYYIERVLDQRNIEIYQILKDIHSSLITEIYDMDIIDDKLIIIEQYINAPTLDSCILNNELTKDEIHHIMKELCDALDLLHQNHIIHRDIKPENIFYFHQHIVLFDFDIARIYNENQTQDTMVLGSVGYAAPEQFGFQQSDERTDIYALGVLMNVLYTSKLPNEELYDGDEQKIIIKATQIDPLQRYKSVSDMKKTIEQMEIKQNNIDQIKKMHLKDFTPPGFRQHKLGHMIIGVLGYLFIIYVCFTAETEGCKKGSFLYVYNQIGMFGLCMIFLAFFTNYCNILRRGFFHNSKYIIIRIIGIILTLLFVIFIFMLIYMGIEDLYLFLK